MAASSSAGYAGNKLTYVFGALGGLLFGYDTAVIAGALLFIREDLAIGAFLQGVVVASLLVGAMVGAGGCGPLSDLIGRRNLILITAGIFTVGAVGAALAPNVSVLIAFRVLLGLAVGSASVTVPVYLAEMAPTEIRGALTSLNQFMIIIGALLASIVNFLLADSEAWRIMLGLGVIPSLILLVGIFTQPETPRWLIKQGREDEARAVLARSRSAERVEAEISEIQSVERREEGGLGELTAGWVRPALLVGIGLAVFQQFIGINTIAYYAPTTLTNAGFDPSAAILVKVVIGVVNVIAIVTVLRLGLIDRIGRKPLLLVGTVGTAASLGIIGIVSVALSPTSTVAAWTTIVCLLTFTGFFSASWGPLTWVVMSEIFPLKIRGAAMGVATILHWAANSLVSLTFPLLLASLGTGLTFIGYALMGVVAFIFVSLFVTETKGRSLEEIENDLLKRIPAGTIRT